MTDTPLKNSFSEYTAAEFIELLKELAKEDEDSETDKRADLLLLHFKKISQHPAGSDLIYYPKDDADNSPEGVTQIVRQWRKTQGLPDFKGE